MGVGCWYCKWSDNVAFLIVTTSSPGYRKWAIGAQTWPSCLGPQSLVSGSLMEVFTGAS